MACLQAAKAAARWAEEIAIADRCLADRDDARAVPDRGAQAAVLGEHGAGDARDLLLGHAGVGLVLEVEHLAVARRRRAPCP